MGNRLPQPVDKVVVLQWGHGGEAVDGMSSQGRSPQQQPRFNGATAVKPWMAAHPSVTSDPHSTLQWGHGGEAVDGPSKQPTPTPVRSLQWGHGGEAVDGIFPWLSATSHGRCFNGATAVKPWMGARPGKLVDEVSCFNGATAVKPWMANAILWNTIFEGWLQWGHGGEAVDGATRGAGSTPLSKASMGPRR